MKHEIDERESYGEFLDRIENDILCLIAYQPPTKEQTIMADLNMSLLVHLVKASILLDPAITSKDSAKHEIDAAIALLTAEKPKRTRKSKND